MEMEQLRARRQGRCGSQITTLDESLSKVVASFLPIVHISSPESLKTWLDGYPLKYLKVALSLSKDDLKDESSYVSLVQNARNLKSLYLGLRRQGFTQLVRSAVTNAQLEQVFIDGSLSSPAIYEVAKCCEVARVKLALSFRARDVPTSDAVCVSRKKPENILEAFSLGRDQVVCLRTQHVSIDFVGVERVLSLDGTAAQFEKLQFLGLCDAGINKQNISSVLDFVKATTTVTDLNLDENQLGDESMLVIADFLKNDHQLKNLYIACVQVASVGVTALANSLCHNQSLEVLYLRDDIIGEAGGKALGDLLRFNKGLKFLVCEYAGIGDAAGDSIAQGLKENDTLRSLLLCYNDIGADTSRRLQEAARRSPVLQTLMVNDDHTDIHKGIKASRPTWPFAGVLPG